MASDNVTATAGTAADEMAQALAARLAAGGYRVTFPPGRDPATFKVTGLRGGPDVEVCAEGDGLVSCHYSGRSKADAAPVIARLLVPGQPDAQSCHTLIATWDGTDVEWHYLPPHDEDPTGPDEATTALLAHLAVLNGDDGKDDPR
jgi:hypothetical protein